MKRIANSAYAGFPDVGGVVFDPNEEASKSKTLQSFTEEVDVNQIVNRALKTGILGDPIAMANRVARFGDFSDVGDFRTCLNRVLAAQKAFDELPADIKVRFNSDPGQLISFLADPANVEEAVKLGLLPKSAIKAVPKGTETAGQVAAADPSPAPAVNPQAVA